VSFRVLVIPEDPTHNGYILKPLIKAILADVGKPAANVTVLTNPKLDGYDHAIRAIRHELPDRYGFWDLWIFVPDADRATKAAMEQLERDLAGKQILLLCCPAVPEVEIYACAAFRDDMHGSWQDARSSKRMKEEVFLPLLRLRGDPRRAGGGRDQMIDASLRNLPLLFQLCPELKQLRDRVEQALQP